jgi:hypothetical protein
MPVVFELSHCLSSLIAGPNRENQKDLVHLGVCHAFHHSSRFFAIAYLLLGQRSASGDAVVHGVSGLRAPHDRHVSRAGGSADAIVDVSLRHSPSPPRIRAGRSLRCFLLSFLQDCLKPTPNVSSIADAQIHSTVSSGLKLMITHLDALGDCLSLFKDLSKCVTEM